MGDLWAVIVLNSAFAGEVHGIRVHGNPRDAHNDARRLRRTYRSRPHPDGGFIAYDRTVVVKRVSARPSEGVGRREDETP